MDDAFRRGAARFITEPEPFQPNGHNVEPIKKGR
jgi:hypothetical protein